MVIIGRELKQGNQNQETKATTIIFGITSVKQYVPPRPRHITNSNVKKVLIMRKKL